MNQDTTHLVNSPISKVNPAEITHSKEVTKHRMMQTWDGMWVAKFCDHILCGKQPSKLFCSVKRVEEGDWAVLQGMASCLWVLPLRGTEHSGTCVGLHSMVSQGCWIQLCGHWHGNMSGYRTMTTRKQNHTNPRWIARVQNKWSIEVSWESTEIKRNVGISGGFHTVARYGRVSLASGECLPI